MNSFVDWGIPFITWLQSWSEWLVAPMQLFSFLGGEDFYLIFMPVLIWCFNAGLGIRIGLILLTSAGLNSAFKLAFGLPRPYWVSREVIAYSSETSFGLPSGHAQNALAIWGRLAFWIRIRWVSIMLSALIFVISISRWFLGVHFPMDTFVGWIIAGVILFIFLRYEDRIREILAHRSLGVLLALCLLLSISLLGLNFISRAFLAPVTVPAIWETNAVLATGGDAIDPLSLDGAVATSGTILGIAAGGVLLFRWGKFDAGGAWSRRLGRYVLGLIGMAVIFYGLRVIFPSGEDVLSNTLRYLRYATAGFWGAYLAPRLFVLVKLA
ncbi:MAG: phosphatase PAP2 family protein [Anaerolineales bacterium]